MSFPSKQKGAAAGFVLLYLAFCISYIDRAAISIALTQIGKEFNLQASELGIVISAFFLGYAIMQVPGGWLADRFGSKSVIIVTIAMWSVFTVLTGLAASLASLLAIRFIFGIAEGGFPPASIKAIAELFSKEARPKISSLLFSSNYAGSMVAPLVMAPLIIWLGWRHAFAAIGVSGIAFAIVYWLSVPRTGASRDMQMAADGKRPSGAEIRELLKNPLLWQLLIVWFGLSCVNKGLDSWM